MKKIVLFNPIPSGISRRKGVLPLALLSIARMLDKSKYDVTIIDESVEDFPETIIEDALCFGISAMIGYQINSALSLAKKIRNRYKSVPIVWGGWHASILPEQTIQNENVDFVVRGQGEVTFAELINALGGNHDFENIAGITYKKDGGVITNPARPLIDPNIFSPIQYDLIDMEKFIHSSEFGSRTITYLSSIGCPFSCGFCAEQVVYGRKWLPLSVDRVISDFKMLKKKYKIDSIIINDSNFFVNQDRVAEICRRMITENIGLKWGNANGRTDQLSRYREATWELMRNSGLQCILTGAETYDDGILSIINKGATVEDTITFSRIAKKHDVKVKFSLMVGLPIADRKKTLKEEFDETINFINILYKENSKNHFLLFLYTPFPGTPLYYKSIELGYKAPSSLDEWGKFLEGLNHVSTPWTDTRIADRIYQVNFYFPFISNSVFDIVKHYPVPLNWLAIAFERILFLVMRIRLKYKLFNLPVEYFVIKSIFRILKKKI